MSASTQYRFYCTLGLAQTQVYPLGFNGCKYSYERKDGTIFFTRKLSGKLVFSNVPVDGITDYDYFYAIETGANNCALLSFLIQKSCDKGVTWTTDWEGEFGTSDGYWDLDNCRFEITPNATGNYNCLLNGIKFNVLDMPNVVTCNVDDTGTAYDRSYDRCRLFNEMLTFLATETCSDITGVKSEFFQLNPDSYDPINYVTKEFNTYTNMLVAQKSDIKEPIPTNAATIANLSFKACMDDLAKLFNVYWTIEEVAGLFYVRIEHLSYFTSTAGTNLTQTTYDKYTSGTQKYRYVRTDMPKYEVWDMAESTMGGRMTYDNACGNNKENESEKRYSIAEFYTDFSVIRWFPEQISNLNGLFLFACTPTGGVNYSMYGCRRNEELILGRLILRFHRYGRPQLDGTFTYFAQPDSSVISDLVLDRSEPAYGDLLIWKSIKNKEQVPIKFPICCDETFDQYKYITTTLGQGDVASAEYDIRSEMITVTLRYAETDIAEITSPSEISGLNSWYKGDAGVTEVATAVSQWDDQSGNGNHLVQATGANKPTYNVGSINLLPAITFDGIDDFMQTSGNVTTFPSKRGTCFIVLRPGNANVATKVVFGTHDAGNPSWDISIDRTTLVPAFELSSYKEGHNWKLSDDIWYAHSYGVTTASDNVFFLFSLHRTSDTEYFGWYNGKRHQMTAQSNPMSATGQPIAAPLVLGKSLASAKYFDGDVCEIILYDRALTDIERQQVERYIFKKYAFIKSYMIS